MKATNYFTNSIVKQLESYGSETIIGYSYLTDTKMFLPVRALVYLIKNNRKFDHKQFKILEYPELNTLAVRSKGLSLGFTRH